MGEGTPLRIALLRAGAMAREHGQVWSEMEDVVVAAAYARDPARAAAWAAPLGIGVTGDLAALLSDPALDTVDVCLPTPVHAPFVQAALDAGRHVFCETPLALSHGEAERMRAAAQRAGRHLQVALLSRSIAACRYAREALGRGTLGRLRIARLHRLGSYLRVGARDHKAHYGDPTTELMTFESTRSTGGSACPARCAPTRPGCPTAARVPCAPVCATRV